MTMHGFDAPSAGEWLDGDGGTGVVVLYKHSPICVASLFAARQVNLFAREFPEIPVYRLDVVTQPELARDLARALGVVHESPQAVWLHDGQVVWSGSHGEVAFDTLERLARSRPDDR
jgi:bacillithiol system protein YtxJ